MASEQQHAADTEAAVARVRQPRADLKSTMVALEQAASAPAATRVAAWARATQDALVNLGAAFEHHIVVTEGSDGLLERIETAAPRLASHVRGMITEHRALRRAISEALDAASDAARSASPDAADAVREQVNALLAALSRHRQKGADLIYEAYEVDIGAGD